MQNKELLYKIIWDVVKKQRGCTFKELLGEGWLSWQTVIKSFDPSKGNLSPYIYAGTTSLLKFRIKQEKNSNATFDSDFDINYFPAQEQKEFKLPDELSESSKKIALLAIEKYNQRLRIPSKAEITSSLLKKGWKWENIRTAYKELAQYF